MYSLRLLRTDIPLLILLHHSSHPSLSANSSVASLAPYKLSLTCSHHCILTRAPGALSDSSHRSNSDCVAMYCATVLWCHRMYSYIVKNSASYLAVAAKVYVHFPSGDLRRSRLVNRLTTWAWNPPRVLHVWGVTTQVSNTKISTACTKALKNNPDTHGSAPSLLRIHVILLQTVLDWDKLFTTAGQSLSATDITRPRYTKEVTIYRGRP